MTEAYLVIVSPAGLELIAEETAHAERFLLRRCRRRRRSHERCYWACLDTDNAQLIRWLIACGHHRPALWLLNEAAIDAGLITPEPAGFSDTPPSFFAS